MRTPAERLLSPGLIANILNHLYPSTCPSCGALTDNIVYAPFCNGCWAGIKKYSGPSCNICSNPFSSKFTGTCSECLKTPPLFSKAMSFGLYEGVLSSAIHIFKFQKIKRLSRPLGKLLLEFDLSGTDAVIPVPLSIRGLRDRGFNQSLLLAKAVSDNAKIPLVMDGLFKERETRPQLGLSAKERGANLRGAFRAKGDFKGKKLLLIDDVMTTGATARECSKQLIKAGAEEVVVLTLARAGER